MSGRPADYEKIAQLQAAAIEIAGLLDEIVGDRRFAYRKKDLASELDVKPRYLSQSEIPGIAPTLWRALSGGRIIEVSRNLSLPLDLADKLREVFSILDKILRDDPIPALNWQRNPMDAIEEVRTGLHLFERGDWKSGETYLIKPVDALMSRAGQLKGADFATLIHGLGTSTQRFTHRGNITQGCKRGGDAMALLKQRPNELVAHGETHFWAVQKAAYAQRHAGNHDQALTLLKHCVEIVNERQLGPAARLSTLRNCARSLGTKGVLTSDPSEQHRLFRQGLALVTEGLRVFDRDPETSFEAEEWICAAVCVAELMILLGNFDAVKHQYEAIHAPAWVAPFVANAKAPAVHSKLLIAELTLAWASGDGHELRRVGQNAIKSPVQQLFPDRTARIREILAGEILLDERWMQRALFLASSRAA